MNKKTAIVLERIRNERINRNISQQAIGNALGLTVSAYNRIEKGRTHLTIHHLFSIADFLKLSIVDFLPPPRKSIMNSIFQMSKISKFILP